MCYLQHRWFLYMCDKKGWEWGQGVRSSLWSSLWIIQREDHWAFTKTFIYLHGIDSFFSLGFCCVTIRKSFPLSKIKWQLKSTSNWARKWKSTVFCRVRKKSIKTEGTTHYVQSNQSWEEILPLVNWQRQILCLTDKIVIYNLILEGA